MYLIQAKVIRLPKQHLSSQKRKVWNYCSSQKDISKMDYLGFSKSVSVVIFRVFGLISMTFIMFCLMYLLDDIPSSSVSNYLYNFS